MLILPLSSPSSPVADTLLGNSYIHYSPFLFLSSYTWFEAYKADGQTTVKSLDSLINAGFSTGLTLPMEVYVRALEQTPNMNFDDFMRAVEKSRGCISKIASSHISTMIVISNCLDNSQKSVIWNNNGAAFDFNTDLLKVLDAEKDQTLGCPVMMTPKIIEELSMFAAKTAFNKKLVCEGPQKVIDEI